MKIEQDMFYNDLVWDLAIYITYTSTVYPDMIYNDIHLTRYIEDDN